MALALDLDQTLKTREGATCQVHPACAQYERCLFPLRPPRFPTSLAGQWDLTTAERVYVAIDPALPMRGADERLIVGIAPTQQRDANSVEYAQIEAANFLFESALRHLAEG